jgi:hypothetical protein
MERLKHAFFQAQEPIVNDYFFKKHKDVKGVGMVIVFFFL